MAITAELQSNISNISVKKPAATMSGARLPGYGTGFGSLSTSSRRSGPVGPNPLPKRLGTLAKGRTTSTALSPRQPPTGVNSVRIAKQTNSAGSGPPKAYDRNLNNVRPIKEIRRNNKEQNSDSLTDRKPNSGSSDTNSGQESAEPKRQAAAALSMDFIKHALSSNKQIYSAQEIKMKSETSWKPTGKSHPRRTKKVSSPTKDTPSRIMPKEPPKSKLIENIKNEGFAPRVKTHELTNQLKVLKARLAGDSAFLEEDEETDTQLSNHS